MDNQVHHYSLAQAKLTNGTNCLNNKPLVQKANGFLFDKVHWHFEI